MSRYAPKFIDPFQWASRERHITAAIDLETMPRLKESGSSLQGECIADLTFDFDREKRVRVSGVIEAQVEVICQRCLQPFVFPVKAQVNWGVLRSSAPESEYKLDFDPILLTGDQFDLSSAVEDEILLSLPIAPTHAEQECQQEWNSTGETDSQPEDEEKQNPFAVLKALKDKP